MKPVLIACALASTALISPTTFADVIEANSIIKKVTVYRQGGASVTRASTVTLPAGNHQIIISKLPTSISDRSNIRAAFNDPNIKVTGISNTEIYQVNLISDEQQQLQEQIDRLRDQRQALQDEISANNLQINFLEKIGSNESGNTETNGASLADKLALINDNATSLYKARSSLQRQLKIKDSEIDVLMKALNQIGGSTRSYVRAVFDVQAITPIQTDFNVTYNVGKTVWAIKTKAALDSQNKEIGLEAIASIKQATGENWNIKDLTLATTVPETGQLPGLSSEFLSVQDKADQEEIVVTASRQRFNRVVELERKDAIYNQGYAPTYLSSNFDARFEITEAVSIASSRNEHAIFLKEFELSVEKLPIKVAPRWNRNAFLYAKSDMTGWGMRLFRPTVSLSRDGAFLGEQQWPDLLPDIETDLPFGIDPQIKVDVTELPPNEGDTGIFGNTKREEKRYLFKVTNNHSTEQLVEVYDRIPVSAHEDVKVASLRSSTKPTENDLDGKTGVIKWVKTIKPGEVWEIHHEYRITYPEKLVLTRRNTK